MLTNNTDDYDFGNILKIWSLMALHFSLLCSSMNLILENDYVVVSLTIWMLLIINGANY